MVTRWILRIGFTALLAAAPHAGFGLWTLAVLLLPLGCALWRADRERITPAVALSLFAASAWMAAARLSPEASGFQLIMRLLVLQLGVSLVSLAEIWLPASCGAMKKSFCMAGGLALVCAAAVSGFFGGLGDELMSLFRAWDGSDGLLLRMYASKLLDLDVPVNELAALRLLGLMTDSVREQLTLSFGLVLEALLDAMLPRLIVGYSLVMTAVCAGTGDAIRAKRVGWRELPEPRLWHLPRGWGLKIVLLGLGSVLSFLTENAAALLFGQICAAVCAVVFSLQGLLMMWWWRRERSISAVGFTVCMTAVCLFIPTVLTLAGYLDQLVDPRRLRGGKDAVDEWKNQG